MDHEDLIDFPVSDTWLAYYHARGMTCRHPVPAPSTERRDAISLMARIERLEQENAALRARAVRIIPIPLPRERQEPTSQPRPDFKDEM